MKLTTHRHLVPRIRTSPWRDAESLRPRRSAMLPVSRAVYRGRYTHACGPLCQVGTAALFGCPSSFQPNKNCLSVILCRTLQCWLEYYQIRHGSSPTKSCWPARGSIALILCLLESMNFCLYFPHLLTDQLKFNTGNVHAVSFSSSEFHKNGCSDSHILLKSVNRVFPRFLRFRPMRENSVPQMSTTIQIMAKFRENSVQGAHFLSDVNTITSICDPHNATLLCNIANLVRLVY